MLQFFPKELLKNCPKGFNMLPLVKVEGEEKKYKTDLSLTPFYNYENDVILCSNAEYLDHDKVLPMNSYLLLRYGDKWLMIDSTVEGEDGSRAGLIPEFINRGDESRFYSYNFNSIQTGISSGQKTVVVLGYAILDDQVLFINRFDFEDEPTFRNRHCSFIPYTPQEFFSDAVINNKRLDKNSKLVLNFLRDVLPEEAIKD